MVKYYGRARQRIGSVNTNQIGLNMSGCPSKVGRQGYLSRYIARRAQCNQKFCGPVYYHGVIWSWNSGRCVAKAPRGQSFNSGVGHKNTPRFACGSTCSTDDNDKNLENAINIINEYFSPNYILVLIADNEFYNSDSLLYNHLNETKISILNNELKYPPKIKQALLLVSKLFETGPVNGKQATHRPALITHAAQTIMYSKYGNPKYFGDNYINVMMDSNKKFPAKLSNEFDTIKKQQTIVGNIYWAVNTLQNLRAAELSPDKKNLPAMKQAWACVVEAYKDIPLWDTSNITSMNSLFYNFITFDQPIGEWDTTNVTDMAYMFYNSKFNQPIEKWNTSNVQYMFRMFYGSQFNQPIGNWDIGNVLEMNYMFYGSVFNQDISKWNTKSVTDMTAMFGDTSVFNQPLNDWNTKNVTDMNTMFYMAQAFNQDIYKWDISNVIDTRGMFQDATSFNKDISKWNPVSVINMDNMFNCAKKFNQDISNWKVDNVTSANCFSKFSALETGNIPNKIQNLDKQENCVRLCY